MSVKLTITNIEEIKNLGIDENVVSDVKTDNNEIVKNENIINLTEHTILKYKKRLDNMGTENEYLSGEVLGIELTGTVDVYDRSGEILDMKNLSLWAKDIAHEKQCYRDLLIETGDSNNNIYDSLHTEKAFIVKYIENFKGKKGVGEFYTFIRTLDKLEDLIKE